MSRRLRATGLTLTLVLVISGVTAACRGGPAADGAELYAHITQEDSYRGWKMWPGKDELYPASEPHGAFLTTYVTDSAFSAIQGRRGSIPYGSIIVKENYTPDKELAALTVMYKVSGYDPDNNDWFWAKYLPDGTIDAEGRVPGCISCHGLQRENDFIYTSTLERIGGY